MTHNELVNKAVRMMTTPVAGRELDALIAENAMGCTVSKILDYGVAGNYRYRCDCDGPSPIGTPPHAGDSFDHDIKEYSTDIAAAWLVVDKIKEMNPMSEPTSFSIHYWSDTKTWSAGFETSYDGYGEYHGSADTAPFAICLAALEAVGK